MAVVVRFQKLHPTAIIPRYAHPGDAGADLTAVGRHRLQPLERLAVPTGLAAEIPQGYEIQVRPKSSLARHYGEAYQNGDLKARLARHHGVTLVNAPGTVDAGYRGEIQVLLINLGSQPYDIAPGQKIAQIVVAPVLQAQFLEADCLSPSPRGSGGFGSTGKTYGAAEDLRPNP